MGTIIRLAVQALIAWCSLVALASWASYWMERSIDHLTSDPVAFATTFVGIAIIVVAGLFLSFLLWMTQEQQKS
jgi:hypothetical protein